MTELDLFSAPATKPKLVVYLPTVDGKQCNLIQSVREGLEKAGRPEDARRFTAESAGHGLNWEGLVKVAEKFVRLESEKE